MRIKRRAPQRRAAARNERIGRAHAPQIVHQAKRGIVAHGEPIDIGHRQRKSGALQQSAEFAQIGERRNARRERRLRSRFRRRRRIGAARSASRRRASAAINKPSGFERAANLHQRAGQIVDELQRQRRHHEIERAVAKRQRLLVGGDIMRRLRSAGRAAAVGSRSAARSCRSSPERASAARTASPGVPRSTRKSKAAHHRRRADPRDRRPRGRAKTSPAPNAARAAAAADERAIENQRALRRRTFQP